MSIIKKASHYDIANRFGSLSKSHQCAIQQILNAQLGDKPHYHILDFGVGNGAFLQKLHLYRPHAEFTGIDISTEMLKIAEKALPLTTIHTNATKAAHFVPLHSQDLVIAHFINAYLPIDSLFNQANLLTNTEGHFSYITTTRESFPNAQKQIAAYIAKNTLFSRILSHYYQSVSQSNAISPNKDALLSQFTNHQFEIINHQRLHIPITLNHIEEWVQFAIEGSWGLNHLTIQKIPKQIIIPSFKYIMGKVIKFPYQDTHVIDVVLAKKHLS